MLEKGDVYYILFWYCCSKLKANTQTF